MFVALLLAVSLGRAAESQAPTQAPQITATSPELEQRDQPVTADDVAILVRAEALLSSDAVWNRKDDRECQDDEATGKRSLFCALEKACIDVLGRYDHRRVALQEVRFAVEDATRGRTFEHRLRDFNNLPETRLEDVKRVLVVAKDRVSARVKASPGVAGNAQRVPPATGDIAPAIVVKVPSVSLGSEQAATILLPATYTASRARYLVLYLLHGGGQDHTAFATRGWFRAQASREMIIVTPSVGDSWYVNSAADPTAKYEDFVVKDLVAYVDSQYRTIASREGRAVAGVSMRAWGAMLLGLKHHQVFGAVGAFSAPYGISRQDPNIDMKSRTQQRFGPPETAKRRERDPGTLVADIPLESVPWLYLARGNQDLFVADNRRFVERLTARTIPYEYRELSPFGHSWDAWDGQLVNFIDLLSKRWS